MTFTTISKEHMNITMQNYNIFIKWGGVGARGGYGVFKGRYVLSWSGQSSVCRSMGILSQGPISSSTRNDRSDFAKAQADLSDCANAQADLSLH